MTVTAELVTTKKTFKGENMAFFKKSETQEEAPSIFELYQKLSDDEKAKFNEAISKSPVDEEAKADNSDTEEIEPKEETEEKTEEEAVKEPEVEPEKAPAEIVPPDYAEAIKTIKQQAERLDAYVADFAEIKELIPLIKQSAKDYEDKKNELSKKYGLEQKTNTEFGKPSNTMSSNELINKYAKII